VYNCRNFDVNIESNNVANNCWNNDWYDFANNSQYSKR
jgi:hypothetical protein